MISHLPDFNAVMFISDPMFLSKEMISWSKVDKMVQAILSEKTILLFESKQKQRNLVSSPFSIFIGDLGSIEIEIIVFILEKMLALLRKQGKDTYVNKNIKDIIEYKPTLLTKTLFLIYVASKMSIAFKI